MTDSPSPRELITMMLDASRALDQAHAELAQAVRKEAQSQRLYRKARATAYIATEGTVGEREALVDMEVDNLRYEAHLAEGLSRAALENVRSKRTQLSVLQTISSAVKEEVAMARYGPDQ